MWTKLSSTSESQIFKKVIKQTKARHAVSKSIWMTKALELAKLAQPNKKE